MRSAAEVRAWEDRNPGVNMAQGTGYEKRANFARQNPEHKHHEAHKKEQQQRHASHQKQQQERHQREANEGGKEKAAGSYVAENLEKVVANAQEITNAGKGPKRPERHTCVNQDIPGVRCGYVTETLKDFEEHVKLAHKLRVALPNMGLNTKHLKNEVEERKRKERERTVAEKRKLEEERGFDFSPRAGQKEEKVRRKNEPGVEEPVTKGSTRKRSPAERELADDLVEARRYTRHREDRGQLERRGGRAPGDNTEQQGRTAWPPKCPHGSPQLL